MTKVSIDSRHIHNNKTLHNIETEQITTTHNVNELHRQY